MSRANTTGAKGLYLNAAGRYRIDLRWYDLPSGFQCRHHERLPEGTTHATAIDRARYVLAQALDGTLSKPLPTWVEETFTPVIPPEAPGVYAVMGAGKFIKIGRATKSIAKRIRGLQTSHPVPLRLLAVLSDSPADEADFHKRFSDARRAGEWFAVTPAIARLIRDTRNAKARAA